MCFEPMATAIREMFYKEDKILFPSALERLSEADWRTIRAQENEIGYFLVSPGLDWPPGARQAVTQAAPVTPPAHCCTCRVPRAQYRRAFRRAGGYDAAEFTRRCYFCR